MRALARYFGNPQDNFKIVHVAGTNGKGSVSLKVARALQHMGLRTGLFTSPHISTFRERISVDQRLISKEKVVDWASQVIQASESQDIDLRFFEIIFMISLLEFQEHSCDYAVIETGIGGRLDCTNIVE